MNMEDLPDHLLTAVLSRLSFKQQFRVRRVCKRWMERVLGCMADPQIISCDLLADRNGHTFHLGSPTEISTKLFAVTCSVLDVYRGKIVLANFDASSFAASLPMEHRNRIIAMLCCSKDISEVDLSSYGSLRYLSCYGMPAVYPPTLTALYNENYSDMAALFDKLQQSGSLATLEHLHVYNDCNSNITQFPRGVLAHALRSIFVCAKELELELLQPLLDYPALESVAICEAFLDEPETACRTVFVHRLNCLVAARKERGIPTVLMYNHGDLATAWFLLVKHLVGLSMERRELYAAYRYFSLYFS